MPKECCKRLSDIPTTTELRYLPSLGIGIFTSGATGWTAGKFSVPNPSRRHTTARLPPLLQRRCAKYLNWKKCRAGCDLLANTTLHINDLLRHWTIFTTMTDCTRHTYVTDKKWANIVTHKQRYCLLTAHLSKERRICATYYVTPTERRLI